MATFKKRPEDKPKTGRPTDYNQEIANRICDLVATHTCGIRKLCATYDDLPDVSTINLWRFKHKEFSAQYLDAKRAQMDLSIEEIDEVFDENILYYTDEAGNQRIDSPSITMAIAKANNRKWAASKLAPKLYGDSKQEQKEEATSLLEKILNGEIKVKHD